MAKNRTRTALRPTLISLAVASCFTASTALANPTGANVVRGTAAIHQAGNLLQITNSPNAIINWQSFSIGANEITRFLQQSPSSAVLNRVTTQNPSQILGSLQSKLLDGVTTGGRVFLINPNGILFGAGAQIDVGGLVASTLRMSDDDFLAGRMRFGDGLGKSVVNDGSIATGAGGSVYLIGSGVTNNGIIRSPQGEVVLAAGNSVELVSPGTPNLRVEIAATDNEARNLGQIISDAGRIGIYAGLINNSGSIRADSAVSEGGRILLKASKSATLESTSVLSAQGQGGGEILVLADETTKVAGRLDASAPNGGDGGFIETSAAKVTFDPSIVITTAAPYGKTGTLLIDPEDFIVGAQGDIIGTALGTLLDANNVIITSAQGTTTGGLGNGDIFVFDSITWRNPNALTLLAERNVNIIGSIDGAGNLNFYAGWDGTGSLNPLAPGPFRVVSGVGDINSSFNSVSTTRGNIFFEAGKDINLTSSTLTAGDGTFFGDRTAHVVAGGSIFMSAVDGGVGVFASAPRGGNANVILNAKTGVISLDGAEIRATGGGGSEGRGGDAKVTLCAGGLVGDLCTASTTGGIGISRSVIEALGGGGSSSQRGGDALVKLTAGSGGIQISGTFGGSSSAKSIFAQGGGGDAAGAGGDASIVLATTGGITVGDAELGGSRLEAIAGQGGTGFNGGNGGAGGSANVTMNGSGISITDASVVNAVGGAGGFGGGITGGSGGNGGNGGNAQVTLTANSISLSGSATINATGGVGGSGGTGSGSGFAAGLGGAGGSATVSLTGGSISLSSSNINPFGGAGGAGGNADEGAAGGAGGNGGNATATISGSSSIAITGSTIFVNAGQGGNGGSASFNSGAGGNGGNGGSAAATLAGGSVSVSTSTFIGVGGGSGGNGGDTTSGGGAPGNGGNGGSATITLTGSSISVSGGSSIDAFGGFGGSGGDVFNASVGVGGNGGNGATASVTLTAGTITVDNSFIEASGGSNGLGGGGPSASGVDGVSGAATVVATATTGNLVVQQFSSIGADGAEGATAAVNLIAAGDITVSNSTVGANGFCCAPTGGSVGVGLAAGGNITVDGGEGIFAFGGSGQVNGGVAAITLAANGGITLNTATVQAFGGGGSSGNGGAAAVTLSGNGISVNSSVVSAQGGSGAAMGGTAITTLNGGAGGITVQLLGGLICEFGCEVLPLLDVQALAISRVGGFGVFADGGGGVNSGGAATVVLNTSGAISVLGTVVGATGGSASVGTGGNALAMLTSGGDITLASNVIADGGLGTTNGTGRINLIFLNSSSNYVVNGQAGLIFDEITLSGFMVDGLPAILNTNLFVTQGAPAFTDVLTATMNQQADVLADQLKAGDTPGDTEDKDKKKLPFCSS